MTVEDPGAVHAWAIRAGAEAVEVPVEASASQYRSVTAAASYEGRLVAVGVDLPQFATFVLQASDGTSWTEVDTTGLEMPADIHDLAAGPFGYVAVGNLRTSEDPSQGGFTPAVFTSLDGLAWSLSAVPWSGEGALVGVVETNDGLLTAGFVDEQAVLWRSHDGGLTWKDAPSPTEPGFGGRGIRVHGDQVLAVRAGPDGAELGVHRSVDDGTSWTSVDTSFAGLVDFPSLDAGAQGFSIVTTRSDSSAPSSGSSDASPGQSQPHDPTEQCYVDIEACRHPPEPEPVIFQSSDGLDWDALDLSGLSNLFRPTSVVHSTEGDTVVLGITDDGMWGAWTWEASNGPVPTRELPSSDQPTPSYSGPPMAHDTLEPGVTYRQPAGGHCGARLLGAFNGTYWYSDEPPQMGHGANPPAHWPVAGETIYGFITLTDPQTVEYSVDADGEEVIATYTSSQDPPPGCG